MKIQTKEDSFYQLIKQKEGEKNVNEVIAYRDGDQERVNILFKEFLTAEGFVARYKGVRRLLDSVQTIEEVLKRKSIGEIFNVSQDQEPPVDIPDDSGSIITIDPKQLLIDMQKSNRIPWVEVLSDKENIMQIPLTLAWAREISGFELIERRDDGFRLSQDPRHKRKEVQVYE